MAIRIGEVDVASQILDNEFRIMVLERFVDLLSTRIPVIGGAVKQEEVERIREEVVKEMQKKYPGSGIALKKRGS